MLSYRKAVILAFLALATQVGITYAQMTNSYRTAMVVVQTRSEIHVDTTLFTTPMIQASFDDPGLEAVLAQNNVLSIRQISRASCDSLLPVVLPTTTFYVQRQFCNWYVLTLSDTAVTATCTDLAASDHIIWAEPDWMASSAMTPNDERFDEQWGLRNSGQFNAYNGVSGWDIDATRFWDVSLCSGCALDVAIIDSGIDAAHPEFAGRAVIGPSFVPGFTSAIDDEGHGTQVAGILGATGNNGIGIAGVVWWPRLIGLKWRSASVKPHSAIGDAIDWVRERNIPLANISAGQYGSAGGQSSAVYDAFMSNITLVAATGNDDWDIPFYPAAFPGTIAVGAMWADGLRWDDDRIDWTNTPGPAGGFGGSNVGPHVDLVAPGGRFIMTTLPTSMGTYTTIAPQLGLEGFAGTSAAAPVVTGIATALIGEFGPGVLAPDDIKEIMERTAIDLTEPGQIPTPKDNFTGWGLVDADMALGVARSRLLRQLTAVGATDLGVETHVTLPLAFNYAVCGQFIPRGLYELAERHRVRAIVPLTPSGSEGFSSPPAVWGVRSRSRASGTDNFLYPELVVTDVTATSATIETFTYRLQLDETTWAWWPACPSEIVVTCTAMGRGTVTAVDDGPREQPFSVLCRALPGATGFEVSCAGLPGDAMLEVLDIHGRQLRSMRIAPNDAGSARHVVGGRWSAGIYFVSVRSGDRRQVVKVALTP